MPSYLALVLHAHLPFVRHPEASRFLEEDWLFEAISEAYLPLLLTFDRLAADSVKFRITLSLSPTLISMLRDELLISRYEKRLDELCELAEKEVFRTGASDLDFHDLAQFYRVRFKELKRAFVQTYKRDLVRGFRALQKAGYLDLITTSATHGFLPLLQSTPEAVVAQVRVGAQLYRETFGEASPGFWLPECGYYPGLERTLAAHELRFFFVDSHSLELAEPEPINGVYAPVFTDAGVAAFARDPFSSEQVWSATRGFPGDPVYREYYRDIGWHLDQDYLRPYLQQGGGRKNTGFKYFRITGATSSKLPYDPEPAGRRAAEHAASFLADRVRQAEQIEPKVDYPPIMVAPYDAELFGHWWFEGPDFLEALIRRAAATQDLSCALITPADYLRRYPEHQVATPSFGSWGAGGYSEMWLNEATDWLYEPLHRCAQRMVSLANEFRKSNGTTERALNQLARELLLAQSSDWAFIMKTGTMAGYARQRATEHLRTFFELEDNVRRNTLNLGRLQSIEAKDNIFPNLDFRIFGDEAK